MSCGLNYFTEFDKKKSRKYHTTIYFSTMQNLKLASFTKEKFPRVRVWEWFSSVLIKLLFTVDIYVCGLSEVKGKKITTSRTAVSVVSCQMWQIDLVLCQFDAVEKILFCYVFQAGRYKHFKQIDLLRNLQLSWKIIKSLGPRALQIFLPG